ncbi:MAG: uroporphyrinogen-III C-methyltransferase, partial [Alphaproteobacteria bacterium]|nr:uroporphyrinogen-III C-methyltransferase [Alphaproteobacteria bacterium]
LPPDLPEFRAGSVWLVGAGPGDPGLLSLLALHALRRADIVVHDALVDARILELARGGAALEFAGKRGGKPSSKQRDISARLIGLAKAGKRVLRLKGGDPFVFGRGAEEALALVAAGVPFRIVPGITAGIGGLTYAGIPTTHRDTNAAVTFITGHNSAGSVPDGLDWTALARGAPVLVIYMALKHLDAIAARLIAGGRPPEEPLAIVSKAATPEQSVVETTLAAAAQAAAEAAIEPPAIVVIGEVVRLRAGLDWLGALAGRTLVPDPLGRADDRERVEEYRRCGTSCR